MANFVRTKIESYKNPANSCSRISFQMMLFMPVKSLSEFRKLGFWPKNWFGWFAWFGSGLARTPLPPDAHGACGRLRRQASESSFRNPPALSHVTSHPNPSPSALAGHRNCQRPAHRRRRRGHITSSSHHEHCRATAGMMPSES